MKIHHFAIIAATSLSLASLSAQASLASSYQFNGTGNWSLDAVGSNNTPVGNINAVIPIGSTVENAYLYSSSVVGNTSIPTISFEGVTYSGGVWANLGTNDGNLTAWRTDITSQVASVVGNGSSSPFTFSVESEITNSQIDGEVLAIIYSNPNEQERTIAFLDGFSDSNGDSTAINLADPLSSSQLADPNFEAMLSLGIGYGFQGDSQYSQVDVNGALLTNCAGGQDDGISSNGGLVTVGGIGDSTNGPNCSATGPFQDDELYSLTGFLSVGDTNIIIDTLNPSHDDNIFFAGINITAVAGVDAPPPNSTPVPTPASFALLGIGLLGLLRVKK